MTSIVTRHFVTVAERQIHYRRAGRGAPVVLLHQSPTSSRELQPLLERLAGSHCVFAPDMPGYGCSDPLSGRTLTMDSLADNLANFMDAVGIKVAGVYGFHTGASLATAFARRHTQRVSVSVAVGLLCLTPAERTRMLQHYLPPFVPAWDGSHLAWLWSRLRDQRVFFPWFARTAAARVAMDAATPAAVQENVPDWLRSGDGYRSAYEAAFGYRPECDLPEIRTPHFVVDFEADPLFGHLDRLAPAPALDIVRCATAADSQQLACDLLQRFPGSAMAPVAHGPNMPAGRISQDYVMVSGIQLRVLRAGAANARPVVVQHEAQSSAAACTGLLAALCRQHAAFAVELPGHGESDPLPDGADYSMEALGALMGGALRTLGLTEVELIGLEAGAGVHVALAGQGGSRVHGLSLVSALDVTDDAVLSQSLQGSYAVPPGPDFYGGHLLRAWHAARDHLLFFPWTGRHSRIAPGEPCLDPELIQRAAVDSILAGAAGCTVRRAESSYPLLARVAAIQCPVKFAAPCWHPRFDHTRSLAARAGRAFQELPIDIDGWTEVLVP